MNELIGQIKQWGIDKGITGPNGKGTLLGQLSKTQEELTETRDAAMKWILAEDFGCRGYKGAMWEQLQDGVGDCAVTLILAAELAGLDFEQCLEYAYDEIKGRTGRMENGTFVKNNK